MRLSFVLVSVFAILALNRTAAQAQYHRAGAVVAEAAVRKKSNAKLESEIAAAVREVYSRHIRQSGATVTVVPLRRMNAREAAKVVKTFYRGRRDVAVAAVPELGLLLLRADKATMREIIGRLRFLD